MFLETSSFKNIQMTGTFLAKPGQWRGALPGLGLVPGRTLTGTLVAQLSASNLSMRRSANASNLYTRTAYRGEEKKGGQFFSLSSFLLRKCTS